MSHSPPSTRLATRNVLVLLCLIIYRQPVAFTILLYDNDEMLLWFCFFSRYQHGDFVEPILITVLVDVINLIGVRKSSLWLQFIGLVLFFFFFSNHTYVRTIVYFYVI